MISKSPYTHRLPHMCACCTVCTVSPAHLPKIRMSEFEQLHNNEEPELPDTIIDLGKDSISEEEKKPTINTSHCHSAVTSVNATRLAMVCFQYYITGALYFNLNLPAGLETTIIELFCVNAMKYNTFYSAYAWSGIPMSIFGGMIVDRVVGIRLGYVMFTALLMIGQGIQLLGSFLGMFWVMVCGRIIFGCGFGTMQSIITGSQVLLFDSNAAIVITSNSGFNCLCAGGAIYVSHIIYASFDFLPKHKYQLGATLGVGFVLMVGGFLSAIVIVLLDLKIKRLSSGSAKSHKETNLSVLKFSFSYWLIVLIGALIFPVFYCFVANEQFFLSVNIQ